MTPRRPPWALPITGAVLLAFALTLAVWLAAGYSLTQQREHTRSRAQALSERYMTAQDLLSTVNSQILLGSVYLRDVLMANDAAHADSHAAVEEIFSTISELMKRYVPVLDSPDERDRIARLRREIDAFRLGMLEVLDTASTGSAAQTQSLLRTKVVSKREVVIRVAEEVRALNREAFVRQQAEVAELYASSQRWFWWILSVAIAASFGIALVAVRYAGGLEKRLQRQLEADARNAAELQRLSAKLITTQEEERRAIARELHDEVGQKLTAIKVELAVAQQAIDAAGLNPDLLGSARAIAEGSVGTIRDLSQLLRPPLLDDMGLAEAIQSHAETFGRRHQIQVDLVQTGPVQRLPEVMETSIYRIVQEALTNVAKHARATRCRITIVRQPGAISITVEDDGVGFDPAGPATPGLGLVGIRERALQFHGRFDIRRGADRGTWLIVELPLAPSGPADEASAAESERGRTLAEAHE